MRGAANVALLLDQIAAATCLSAPKVLTDEAATPSPPADPDQMDLPGILEVRCAYRAIDWRRPNCSARWLVDSSMADLLRTIASRIQRSADDVVIGGVRLGSAAHGRDPRIVRAFGRSVIPRHAIPDPGYASLHSERDR